MGDVGAIVVLKLGGSLITNKDVPLSINDSALRSVSRAVRESGLPNKKRKLFLIHGGGSFGHYYAKRFGLGIEPRKVPATHIAKTTASMMELHLAVVKSLSAMDVAPETILAQDLLSPGSKGLTKEGARRVKECFDSGLIPVSFGNVGVAGGQASIISGDKICELICKEMPVRRVVFAMDVDGIYPTPDLQGEILGTISEGDSVKTGTRVFDVTGGVRAKIDLGFRLARTGAEVFYVNGTKDKRLLKLLRFQGGVKATCIPAHGRME